MFNDTDKIRAIIVRVNEGALLRAEVDIPLMAWVDRSVVLTHALIRAVLQAFIGGDIEASQVMPYTTPDTLLLFIDATGEVYQFIHAECSLVRDDSSYDGEFAISLSLTLARVRPQQFTMKVVTMFDLVYRVMDTDFYREFVEMSRPAKYNVKLLVGYVIV